MPPIDPNEPCGSGGSSFHCESSQRYPCARRFGGTSPTWSVVDDMPSGRRIFAATKSSYFMPETVETIRPRIAKP